MGDCSATISGALFREMKKTGDTHTAIELCNLIKNDCQNESIPTTFNEILYALRNYIWRKKLYDHSRMLVVIKGDPLEQIFGIQEFPIFDVTKLLNPLYGEKTNIPPKNDIFKKTSFLNSHNEVSVSIPISDVAKRKTEDEPVSELYGGAKKICVGETNSSLNTDSSPWILYIPQSPVIYDSSTDSHESIQDYDTSVIQDESDEICLESDSDTGFSGILTVAETFEVEFEPNTETDESVISLFSSDSESDFEKEISILTFVCKTDSDEEFFADNSSDEFEEDAEISELDRWICKHCNGVNQPPNRFCLKCFETRTNWLAESVKKLPVLPPVTKRKPRLKRKKHFRKYGKGDTSKKGSKLFFDVPSTSEKIKKSVELLEDERREIQSISISKSQLNSESKVCLICCERTVNSSIIHGRIGHSVSCYRCAKRLEQLQKRCPICRRTIEKVVYQISSS